MKKRLNKYATLSRTPMSVFRSCFKSRHEASKTQIPAIREQRNIKKHSENLMSLRLSGENFDFQNRLLGLT
jgi:hypothetical protein